MEPIEEVYLEARRIQARAMPNVKTSEKEDGKYVTAGVLAALMARRFGMTPRRCQELNEMAGLCSPSSKPESGSPPR